MGDDAALFDRSEPTISVSENLTFASYRKGRAMDDEKPVVMTVRDAVTHLRGVRDAGKADEPVFILRGQDILAAEIIMAWVAIALARGVAQAKVNGAAMAANEFYRWPTRKLPD